MTSRWPDFVVTCEKHRTPYVVQKFRWVDSQGVWVPTKKGRTRQTELRNNSNAEFWQHIEAGAPPDGNIRLHYETRCTAANGCTNKLPADVDSLMDLFKWVVLGVQYCAKARAHGHAPSEGWAAAYAGLITDATEGSITVTIGNLRAGLRLRNTLNGK